MDIIYKNRIPRNFRHVMPLNERIVYRSFPIQEIDVSKSIQIQASYVMSILFIFFNFYSLNLL